MNPFDPNANPVEPQQEQQVENPLEALVGEDKKFRSVDDLARGKIESDRFITQLQKQNAEMQSLIEKQEEADKDRIDRLIQKLENDQANSTTLEGTPPMNNTGEAGNTNPMTQEPTNVKEESVDIESTVDKLLRQREAQSNRDRNVQVTSNKLNELYGDRSASVVKDVASKMGVSVEWMEDIAGQNPDAFFKLVGVNGKDNSSNGETSFGSRTTNSNTEMNPSSQNTTVRNNSYYMDLKKKNGNSWFYKPEVQKMMWKDAEALGRNFLN